MNGTRTETGPGPWLLLAATLALSIAPSAAAEEWSYEGEHGPTHWAGLSSDYAQCGAGRLQSPIDLSNATAIEQIPLVLDYRPAALRIAHHEHVVDVIDNGHTIQVTYGEGSTLNVGDQSFDLAQYHFHSPSEHTTDGTSHAAEIHLVHQSTDGKLAVVGVLIDEGEHNPAFEPVWENFPTRKGEARHLEHIRVDIDAFFPARYDFYQYRGSLTTPPCSEGVAWFVFQEPIALSKEQIQQLRDVLQGPNNRPIQERNERPLLRTNITTEPAGE